MVTQLKAGERAECNSCECSARYVRVYVRRRVVLLRDVGGDGCVTCSVPTNATQCVPCGPRRCGNRRLSLMENREWSSGLIATAMKGLARNYYVRGGCIVSSTVCARAAKINIHDILFLHESLRQLSSVSLSYQGKIRLVETFPFSTVNF